MPAKRASKISVKGASLKEGLCESKKSVLKPINIRIQNK
jgi:hypothetical protein